MPRPETATRGRALLGTRATLAFLARALYPVAEKLGLEVLPEIAFFGAEANSRVPDIAIARPSNVSKRGLEGRCELVVEVLWPADESYQKMSFHAAQGVSELVYVEPESRKAGTPDRAWRPRGGAGDRGAGGGEPGGGGRRRVFLQPFCGGGGVLGLAEPGGNPI